MSLPIANGVSAGLHNPDKEAKKVDLRNEIMTIQDLADVLKMTRRQVYELTRTRGQARLNLPVPVLRINGNIRFRRTDIEKWLDKLAEEGRKGN